MSTPALMPKAGIGLPTSGYSLVADGQAKTDFKTYDQAVNAAKDLRGVSRCFRSRFTMTWGTVSSALKPLWTAVIMRAFTERLAHPESGHRDPCTLVIANHTNV